MHINILEKFGSKRKKQLENMIELSTLTPALQMAAIPE